MARSFVTSVHQSKPNSPSLRTTVPVGVATILNVQRGDSLVWMVVSSVTQPWPYLPPRFTCQSWGPWK